MRKELTVERLKQVLKYYPNSGEFMWLVKTSKQSAPFTPAGYSRHDGYSMLCVDRVEYLAHRVAWLYVHGKWPHHHLDHINGDRSDNRIRNLREATVSENHQNRLIKDSTGTEKVGKRWRAYIKIPGTKGLTRLGRFDTQEEAHQAYLKAKKKYHRFQPVARKS